MMNRSNKKSGKMKTFGTVLLFGFLILYLAAFFGFMTYAMYDTLSQMGLQKLIPALIVVSASLFVLMTALFSCDGFLYRPKDIQILMSLPVSHTTVLISKFLGMYLYNLITAASICLPTGIVYLVLEKNGALSYIALILTTLFVPLLPLAVGSLLSSLIGLVTRRMKHKNFISIAASAILFVVFMLLSQNSEGIFEYLAENGGKIYDALTKWYLPSALASTALEGGIADLLFFMLLNALPFVIIIPVMSKFYATIVAACTQTNKSEKFTYTASEKNTKFYACFKKELSRVLSSATCFMNSCTGILILVVLGIAFTRKGDGDLSVLADSSDILPMIITLSAILASTMASTTSSAISLEGKSLWIYKTAPIDTMTVFKAKTSVNIVLNAPAAIIYGIAFSVYYGFSIPNALTAVILPFASVVYTSVIGLVINLAKPRLDWTSEAQAIKQSSSVVLTVLEGICFTVLICATTILPVVFLEIPFCAAAAVCAALIIAISLLLYSVLGKWGVRKFNQLY